MLCGSLDGRGVWERMDTCICMAESLCCSPETTTTLLTGYTPVQNKKFKVWVAGSLYSFGVVGGARTEWVGLGDDMVGMD